MVPPSHLDRDSLAAIETLLRRFERRLRLQRTVVGIVEGGALGLLIAAAMVAAVRTGWAPDGLLWAALAIFLTGATIGALIRGLQGIDPVAAAQQIDRTHGLHDRLSTAVSLSQKGPVADADRPFVAAQLRDALKYLRAVDPRRAAPWQRPPDLMLLGLAALALIAFALVPLPDHRQPLPAPFAPTYDQVLDDATLAMERERLRELQRELEKSPDEKAQQVADEIEALLQAVEERTISEREFLDEVDRLVDEYFSDDSDDEELNTLSQALAEAAESARRDAENEAQNEAHDEAQNEAVQELDRAMEALEEGDFKGASEAISELAERLNEGGIDPEEAEALADMLERFSDQIDSRDERLQELVEEHRDAFEEMAEEFAGNDDFDQQLLDDTRQQAEDAAQERDDYANSEARRQLERLSRELDDAADDLRDQEQQQNRDGSEESSEQGESNPEANGDEERDQPSKAHEDAPEDAESAAGNQGESQQPSGDEPNYQNEVGRKLDDASRQLEEMEQQRQHQQQREQARRQLEEMRENMSRSAGDSETQRRRGEQMEDYMDRARGESGDEPEQSPGGEEGQQGEEGPAQQTDQLGEAPQDGTEGDEPNPQGSDSAGAGGPQDDDGLLDDGEEQAGDDDFKYRDEQLTGAEGEEGPTRSETIRSASEEGFATVDYRDVYAEYEEIAEEVMEREDVPDGYRHYIERYFQLIRPAQ